MKLSDPNNFQRSDPGLSEDMSIDQASEFWDSHDFTKFPDIQEVKGVRFKLLKEKVGVNP